MYFLDVGNIDNRLSRVVILGCSKVKNVDFSRMVLSQVKKY